MRTYKGPRAQRGAVSFKLLIGLVVLGLLAQAAYIFLPLYIAAYDFNSQVEKEAGYGAQKSNEAIVKALVEYAKERHLDVKKENVHIERTKSRLTISANYTVPVKTLVYTHNWDVSVEKAAVLF